MLPQAYQLPAALLLIFSGALTCFAGYRLFRIVLAIYGFILGAMLASSTMAASNTIGMVLGALVGGLIGAFILVFAYFVGIALVGAGLGALIAHLGWTTIGRGDPPVALVIALALAGAVAAMFLQRYVIIVATAFGGAWTVIVGGIAFGALRAAPARGRAADVWILYPLTPGPGRPWVPAAWIALGLVGVAVQLALTGKRQRKKK
jgi:hypothetical protein